MSGVEEDNAVQVRSFLCNSLRIIHTFNVVKRGESLGAEGTEANNTRVLEM